MLIEPKGINGLIGVREFKKMTVRNPCKYKTLRS